MKAEFPIYKKTSTCLYCFVAQDKMYKIEMIGTNKNPGLSIDHYKTRKMFLSHFSNYGEIISQEEFRRLYNALFAAALARMI